MSIIFEGKEEKKFILKEGEGKEKDAYILYEKIYLDEMMEGQEEYGEWIGQGENLEFKSKSQIKPIKEMIGKAVKDWKGVLDKNENELELTSDNIYRVLVQVEKLSDFLDEAVFSTQEDEEKN